MRMPWKHQAVAAASAPATVVSSSDPQVEAVRTEFLSIVAEVRDLAATLTSLGLDN